MQFLRLIFVKKLQAPAFQLTFPFLIPMPKKYFLSQTEDKEQGPASLGMCTREAGCTMLVLLLKPTQCNVV